MVVLWDLAGPSRFKQLWKLYLKDSRVIFLITDSTLENVLDSKDILQFIRNEKLTDKVQCIANKQDLPGALTPALVQRILGIRTEGMVAIDKTNRTKALDIIHGALEANQHQRSLITF